MSTVPQPPRLPDGAYELSFGGPSDLEQYTVELINRARADAAAELARLGENLASGVSTRPSQPLAIVAELDAAAQSHSDDMLARGYFSHTDPDGVSPFDRMRAENYTYRAASENIAYAGGYANPNSQSRIDLHHDGLWGSDGHQRNFMNGSFSEVGIGFASGSYQGVPRATMLTQKFGDRGHEYITGVVIDDRDGDGFYDVGEGQGGVRITVWNGQNAYATSTWEAGGYALRVAPGAYTILFEGGDLDGAFSTRVTVGEDNVKVDVVEGRDTTLIDDAPRQPDEPTPEPEPEPDPPSLTGGTPSNGDDDLGGGASSDEIRGLAGADRINAEGGDDTVYGGAGDDEVHGGGGHDFLVGNSGDDLVSGGAGDDDVYGGGGDDALYGGAGNDLLVGQGGADVAYGGAGDDRVIGRSGDDELFGEAGADVLLGNLDRDTLVGGDGNDVLRGGADADVLFGGRGDDIITGDAGDDQIHGDAGNDILAGGAGADRFVFDGSGGDNVIRDFVRGVDVIDLTARGGQFDDLSFSNGPNGLRVQDGNLTILVKGVGPSGLSADDFLL